MRIVSIGLFASEDRIALANALAEMHDVTLMLARDQLAASFPGAVDLGQFLRQHGLLHPRVTLRLIDYPKGQYRRKLAIASEILQEIAALRPDVVHHESSPAWMTVSMPWLRRFPLVVTIHDATQHVGETQPAALRFAVNLIETRLAHQLIVHGRQQADVLHRVYRAAQGKINVVPLGTPTAFRSLAQETVGSLEPHTVLFFGRLCAYKGLEVLLNAIPRVASRVPDVRVVIAGNGDCPAVQRAAAAHPAWYEVHNRFIPASEVAGFFQRARLVVLPYIEATQSGVVPLAYLFGRPVVCTRVGSIPEVVDHGITGYLVEPNDPAALADAMVRLLQDEDLRATMGRAAAIKAERDLSWEAIALKTTAIYERARQLAACGRSGAF